MFAELSASEQDTGGIVKIEKHVHKPIQTIFLSDAARIAYTAGRRGQPPPTAGAKRHAGGFPASAWLRWIGPGRSAISRFHSQYTAPDLPCLMLISYTVLFSIGMSENGLIPAVPPGESRFLLPVSWRHILRPNRAEPDGMAAVRPDRETDAPADNVNPGHPFTADAPGRVIS